MKKILAFVACLLAGAGCIVALHAQISNKNNHVSLHTTNTPTQVLAATTVMPTATATPTPSEAVVPSNTCDNLLVLVNKQYALPSTYVPSDLVYLSAYNIPVSNTSLEIRAIVIPMLQKMVADAKTQGLDLIVLSPYRSYNTQQGVHQYYVATEGEQSADMYSALPGHSQHQLGTAIDFSTIEIHDQLDASFGTSLAGKWMMANAYKYGFVISYPQGDEDITGYAYEPWHYRYVGVENAKKIMDSGLILEQYLQKYGVLPHC